MKSSFSINPIITAFFILLTVYANAQTESKDFTDVIKKWKKDTTFSTSLELVIDKNYISVLPVVGYAPANGFLIGGVLSLSKLLSLPSL